MDFAAVVELGGKTATGIVVPDGVIESLGGGGRPAVLVTLGSHSYRTTASRRDGRFMVPLSAENRTAAGLVAGQEVRVTIELDEAPREVALPVDLGAAMDDAARTAYDALSFTHRKEWVRWIEDAKKPETRSARIERTVAVLREGRKAR